MLACTGVPRTTRELSQIRSAGPMSSRVFSVLWSEVSRSVPFSNLAISLAPDPSPSRRHQFRSGRHYFFVLRIEYKNNRRLERRGSESENGQKLSHRNIVTTRDTRRTKIICVTYYVFTRWFAKVFTRTYPAPTYLYTRNTVYFLSRHVKNKSYFCGKRPLKVQARTLTSIR